jgi:choline dehydrogenase-like flavoprotein
VLLIEARGEENVLQDVPMLAALTHLTPGNWGCKTEQPPTACIGFVVGRCKWPRGKLLGDSSVLNYMVYTSGNCKDYDVWEEKGCEGWGYEDLKLYFLRSEDMLIADLFNDTKYHSTKGQLPITFPSYHTQTASDFGEAGVETVYNAERQIGYPYVECTIKRLDAVQRESCVLGTCENEE